MPRKKEFVIKVFGYKNKITNVIKMYYFYKMKAEKTKKVGRPKLEPGEVKVRLQIMVKAKHLKKSITIAKKAIAHLK